MGFTTVIAVVALLIFSVVFVIPVLTNIQDIQDNGFICGVLGLCITPTEDTQRNKDEVVKQEAEADKVLPLSDGKLLCDIKVEVDAQLIDEFGFAKISIDASDPSNYTWYCQFPNQWGFLNNLSGFSLLDIFALESEFIHAEIVLKDKDNPDRKYDANHPDYKEMYRDIRLVQTSGILKTPYNMDQSFYIDNVVHDDYILEIYYGREINNLGAGNPLDETVCKVGTTC